jgi:ATP-dependent Clp protease ATP-binding subunit ClpB
MNFDQYTIKAREVIQAAQTLAAQNDHSEIGADHLLFALLTQKQGIIAPLVEKIGGTQNALGSLIAETQKLLDANPKMHGNVQIPLSGEAAKILANAEKEAVFPTPDAVGNTRQIVPVDYVIGRCL